MNALTVLPLLNAVLNGTCAVLIVIGRGLIRRKRVAAHRAIMIAAVLTSAAFLTSYLIYHAMAGVVRFQGQGWARPVYFTILVSHTILAAVIVPLVLVTLARGLKGSFERHRAIARWTFPIWLYVSVTGVVIYLMLYHFFAA
jgi:putative membrane protein